LETPNHSGRLAGQPGEATTPRHGKILKKRAAFDLIFVYFDRYENKREAAKVLETEMQRLQKPLPKHSLLPLWITLKQYE